MNTETEFGDNPTPPDFDKKKFEEKLTAPFDHPHPEYHENPEAAKLRHAIDVRTIDRASTQWLAVVLIVILAVAGLAVIWYLFQIFTL
ncbi:MAG: hypothetical protein WEB58_15095 [Planctomycetaceae bacterium]